MRTAIVVSTPVPDGIEEQIAADRSPRRDYLTLCEALDATLIYPSRKSPTDQGRLSKVLEIFKVAWTAFRLRHTYDAIVTDLERTAVVLALLFKVTGTRRHLVSICHGEITGFPLLNLVKLFRLTSHIGRFIAYSPSIGRAISSALDLRDDRVVTVRHPADHRFWRPSSANPDRLIASAGLFRRDYGTLMRAIDGLDVSLVAAAYSPWVSASPADGWAESPPENVSVVQLDYGELRELYGRSIFVAVPLLDGTDQAGSLVIYEAMAMGKAVVATRTAGLESLGIVRDGETGLFVEPGDVDGWRRAIGRLLEHPEMASEMGLRARAVVEQGLNLDTYTADIVRAVGELSAPSAEIVRTAAE